MGSQVWAQITFRYKINSNGYKNVLDRWPAKGTNPRSGDVDFIYIVYSIAFLIPVLNFEDHMLYLLTSYS